MNRVVVLNYRGKLTNRLELSLPDPPTIGLGLVIPNEDLSDDFRVTVKEGNLFWSVARELYIVTLSSGYTDAYLAKFGFKTDLDGFDEHW